MYGGFILALDLHDFHINKKKTIYYISETLSTQQIVYNLVNYNI